jgi:TonB family protein
MRTTHGAIMKAQCFSLSLFALVALGRAAAAEQTDTKGIQPLRIIKTTELQFPLALNTMTASRGEASVLINVDAQGRLIDWLVVSYTQKPFADEAVKALKEWRFEPARRSGEAIAIRTTLTFNFEADRKVMSVIPTDMFDIFVRSWRGERVISQVCRPQDLDQPLQTVKTVQPRYAPPVKAPGDTRSRVLVDFYVDETGRPRMPVVVQASDTLFAAAAVDALDQWRFAAPTRGREPVAVHVQQEFVQVD